MSNLLDRVLETTTSTGNGNLALGGAVSGYNSFSTAGYATIDAFPYQIVAVDSNGVPNGQWETGIGRYTGTTFIRDDAFNGSSGANTKVNFSAGTKRIGVGLIGNHLDMVAKPNQLFNGLFQLDQRNEGASMTLATISGTTNYGPDRWANWKGSGASTTSTGQRQTSGMPTGFRYSWRFGRTAGQTGTAVLNLAQILDTNNSIGMAGQYVTMSFWAKAGANLSSGGAAINASIVYGTGTDQSMASFAAATWTGYTETTKSISPDTTFTRYYLSASIPSTATQIGVWFYYTPSGTAGANDWVEITGVNLVEGRIPTTIERLPISQEIARCQYYWRKSAEIGTLATTQNFYSMHSMYCGANGNGAAGTCVRFDGRMRTTPTITTYDLAATPASGKITKVTNSGGANSATNGITPINVQACSAGFNLECPAAANIAGLEFNWTADAEL